MRVEDQCPPGLQFPHGYSAWLKARQDVELAAAGLYRAQRRGAAMNTNDVGPPADLAGAIRAAHKRTRSADVRERAERVAAFLRAQPRPLAEETATSRTAAANQDGVPAPVDLGARIRASRGGR